MEIHRKQIDFFFLAADEESGVSLLKEQLHNVTVRFFFLLLPLRPGKSLSCRRRKIKKCAFVIRRNKLFSEQKVEFLSVVFIRTSTYCSVAAALFALFKYPV